MLAKLLSKFYKNKTPVPVVDSKKSHGFFSTEYDFYDDSSYDQVVERAIANTFQRPQQIAPISTGRSVARGSQTMDDDDGGSGVKQFTGNYAVVPAAQICWYGSQSFIGYQICAIFSQHWLIDKVCTMPAKDAVRKGYEITINDGQDVPPEIKDLMRQLDVDYKIIESAVEFVRMGRIFGIRVAVFEVESDDPEYYFKPFNPDSVKPGSYRGITQIDPFWIIGQLDNEGASNPFSKHFYEPTWWQVGARRIHRSHICIFRTGELPDILKPTYLWGGVSVPQKIYERVYAAERTANEAPLLALTKRTDVVKTDLAQAESQGVNFFTKFKQWVFNRNNYGIKVIDLTEEMQQFDTSLTDLDAVIMTQYQLVAAAGDVPAVKLLGTSPKGFNTTGEFEEASYHEMLESLQKHDLTPLIERHHQLVILSDIAPKFRFFKTCIKWESLDAMTAKEAAETNEIKARTDATLVTAGAIDGNDVRDRLIADPLSGYSGIESGAPEPVEEEEDPQNAENSEEESDLGEKSERLFKR